MVTKSTSPIGGDMSIANSIDDMISFTHDVPSNYSDGFLPVLDVKVKLQDSGNLVYQFYEKPTKSCKVILADSLFSSIVTF